nr:putative inorganic phosphate cotransporter [Leptinotarsa decemlineata]
MAFKPLYCVFGNITIPQRYVMVFMMQLALLNAYHLRVVLNIAITEMIIPSNQTEDVDACPEYVYEAVEMMGGMFDWPSWIESMILYAFYIGYIFSHIPGGWIADKLGARHVMGTCMLLSIIVTFLYPLAIQKGGYIAAIVLRVFLGLCQGPLLPTVSTFIQCWVPPEERAFLGGIAFGGSNMGTVTGSIFTGIIIKETNSWSTPFYIWGALSLVWYIFYLFMVFSKPQTHPYISEKELKLVVATIEPKKEFRVPWLKISKSLPVWALLAGQFAHNYIFFTLFTNLPKYLKEILKMNVESNAAATALPFLALWISNIVFAYISSFLTNRNFLTIIQARKMWTAFSLIVPSIILVLTVYVGCSRAAAITLYTVALFLVGPFFSGMKVNVNDLTTHYAGTIMAVVNGLGAIAGILGPFIVGALTTKHTLQEWHIVFWIMLSFSVILSILYCIFAKADRQEWDFLDEEPIEGT